MIARTLLAAALVVGLAGCGPAPGTSGAPPSAAYVQHLSADQVDAWRGIHYDGLIIDLRTSVEFDDDLSHLDNAVLVPIAELESRLPEFDRYRNAAVLVYDRTGTNATRAGQILVLHDFRDVSVLDGGIKAYRDWLKTR
jgi:rhodanese-related sulfurtransferase